MIVTRDTLNTVMEFDHVIRVHPDGTVTAAPDDVWEPEVSISAESDPESIRRPFISANREWSLMNGYSGQQSYAGPVMDPSEFIGGRMADDILSTPGLYVAVVVRDDDTDTDSGDDDLAGWAVAYIAD